MIVPSASLCFGSEVGRLVAGSGRAGLPEPFRSYIQQTFVTGLPPRRFPLGVSVFRFRSRAVTFGGRSRPGRTSRTIQVRFPRTANICQVFLHGGSRKRRCYCELWCCSPSHDQIKTVAVRHSHTPNEATSALIYYLNR
jgi:hypothetical protein